MRRVVPLLGITLLATAGDGIRPRGAASDYPAHQDENAATIAAAVLTQDQIRKIFGGDVGRRYMVVEVAVYPNPAFEIDMFDFRLRDTDGDLTRPEKPRDVADVWAERDPKPGGGPTVINEAGVIYETGRDPVTGQRRSGVGTYESTTVTNDPRAQQRPSPRSNPDAYAIAAKLHDFALPEGRTRDAVAGYLYFPKPSKKGKAVELRHSRDDASATLSLPVK
jgi:hypothetical protein